MARLAWHRRDDESIEQFDVFNVWRALPHDRKRSKVALLAALGWPDNKVKRNKLNRWRRRFAWEEREGARLAAEAARTDEALAERRRDIQTLALGVATNYAARLSEVKPEKLTTEQVRWLAHYESRIRRDDAIVPSVTRTDEATRTAREFMVLGD